MSNMLINVYKMDTEPLSVQAQYISTADYALFLVASATTAV
jgi:hypothetical protein